MTWTVITALDQGKGRGRVTRAAWACSLLTLTSRPLWRWLGGCLAGWEADGLQTEG